MKGNDININVNTGDNKPGIFSMGKEYFDKLANTGFWKIFKVYLFVFLFLATFLSGFALWKVINNNDAMNAAMHKVIIDDKKQENIRDFVVTPRIQHDLEILVYSLGAERAFLFELHNGKKNTSGLPFRFADMTYEEVNDEKRVEKVAMEFQDIPLTLYKFPHYLQKQKLMIGGVDEISKVDADFADHIRNIGGKYLGMVYITNGRTPLGFLCLSYHDTSTKPSDEIIETKLLEYSKVISQLLDLEVQMNKTDNTYEQESY